MRSNGEGQSYEFCDNNILAFACPLILEMFQNQWILGWYACKPALSSRLENQNLCK